MWTGPNITKETSVAGLVNYWLTSLRAEGRLEATTINEYERVLRKLVVPELGDLRLSELTAEGTNVYLDGLRGTSVNRRRKATVVTGAMLNLAVGLGALQTNPGGARRVWCGPEPRRDVSLSTRSTPSERRCVPGGPPRDRARSPPPTWVTSPT